MSFLVGIDLGTSKITALAVDVETGTIVARATVPNDAEITAKSDLARGRSEWDAVRIVDRGHECLRRLIEGLGEGRPQVVGIGVTGQQHGVVLVDCGLKPLTPLINWQDRRGHDPIQGSTRSYLEAARELAGDGAIARTGCRLHPGFAGLTLFWLKQNGLLPAGARACFIMDLFCGIATGSRPVTEPSCAASSGLLDVGNRTWDLETIRALGLPPELFPEIREANRPVGGLTADAAESTGLLAGTPVFAPIGDHQASFLGSMRNPREDVLVNVGTGAQVAVYTDGNTFVPPIELRPLPMGGNLLSNVGLAGGWSYQSLENFFRLVCRDVFDVEPAGTVYERLNRLAAAVPPGCHGLVCDPHFSGSRADPTRRGAFQGVTPQNLTPGHFARAVLEGMARSLSDGYSAIRGAREKNDRRVVAAGNALRENAILRESVCNAFGLPLVFTRHREEAAFGAALAAAVGAGIFTSLEEAARLIVYE